MENKFDPNYDLTKTDAPNGYSTWTDNPELAKQYGSNIYEIELPKKQQGKELVNADGERVLFLDNEKKAGLNNISGKEYLVYNDHEMYNSNLVKEFKTKSQLTDIWKKANNEEPLKQVITSVKETPIEYGLGKGVMQEKIISNETSKLDDLLNKAKITKEDSIELFNAFDNPKHYL